jgi:predicted MFS family arabinose efflux permease
MFLNAMYGGLGQSLGAIIGGKLQSKFGTVQTFIYSALFDLVLVSFVIVYLNLRKESNFRNPSPILPKPQLGKN